MLITCTGWVRATDKLEGIGGMAEADRTTSPINTLIEVAQDPDGYIARWKDTTGRKVIGALPMNFPAEIAHAAGALSVVIQEDREPITLGRNLLTEYNCGYSKNLADKAATGRLALYDGFFLADHCVQLLGALDVVREEVPEKPAYFGQLISSLSDSWTFDQVRLRMVDFRQALGDFTGNPISDDDLSRSIALFNTNARMLQQIFSERREGNATFTSTQIQAIVKSSMIMDKEDHSTLLSMVLANSGFVARDDRIRLHLSGHFCHAPKPELLELIEDCGAVIVDDDLYHGTRYAPTTVSEDGDPLSALASAYLERNVAVPCPTVAQHDVDWDGYLLKAIEDSSAEGAIVLMAKYCEPHMLYYPELRKALNARGIPHLLIETEHEGMPFETFRTRVEAMLERIRHNQLVGLRSRSVNSDRDR